MSEREAQSVSSRRYATIVADPPWPHAEKPTGYQRSVGSNSFLDYDHMELQDIAALPVSDLAKPGAHLYLWTTNRFLFDSKVVAEAWGAKVIQTLVWCKSPMGLGPGAAFASTTEFVLFCRFRVGPMLQHLREEGGLTRGDIHRELFSSQPTGIVYRWEEDACYPTARDWEKLQPILGLGELVREPNRHESSWFHMPRGIHSQKPEGFLDIVEQVSPGPYLELFARRNRLGWDTWGNESLEHVEVITHGRDCPCTPCRAEDWDAIAAGLAHGL